MKIIKQIIRGCGTLPYVGEHPGTIMLVMFCFVGAIAGSQNGLLGALSGAVLTGLITLPLYLWGAYDRANLSDSLSRNNKE